MKKTTNILLVDVHFVVRKGIELVLNSNLLNISVTCVEDYDQAIDKLNSTSIDLILLDININGDENVKIMKELKSIQADVKILVFSSHEESQYGLRYIQNGADGYLNKFCSEAILINAIKTVLLKGYYHSEEMQKKISSLKSDTKISSDLLSNREFEIAQLLLNGYGNLEISNKLNIQMSTVSTYKNRLFEKLNVTSVVALSDFFKSESKKP